MRISSVVSAPLERRRTITPLPRALAGSCGAFCSLIAAFVGAPPRLKLFANLFQYYAVQGIAIDYETALENNYEICSSELSAWIAFRARCYNREAQYREDLRRSQYPRADSGVQPAIPLPNATQLAYLVAWLIETENNSALALISSASKNDLTFFRTSSQPAEDALVAMAYVPNHRLIVRTFRTLSPPSTLKTLDAFILV